tara:strand:- start:715 stop:1143 length:429 start_codon:yes stop_codon:yes gene_type:complete
VGPLRRNPRATRTEPRKWGGRTGDRKRTGEELERPVGGKTTGELRWEEPDERKGKEATGKAEENITELFRQGKHDQNRKPSRRGKRAKGGNQQWNRPEARVRENEEEKNWTQGRGKETERKRTGNESAEMRGGPIPRREKNW